MSSYLHPNDRETCGKAYVVRIFDDDRSDQTSEGLNGDRASGPSTKVPQQILEETLRVSVIGEDDGEQCRNGGKRRKLDVLNPKVGLGALEDHLEVDTCEPGRETHSSHRTKSFQETHDVGIHRCGIMDTANWSIDRLVRGTTGRNGLELNDADSESRKKKSHPLCRRKGLA